MVPPSANSRPMPRGQVSQHRSQLGIPFHVEQQAAPPPHGAWRPRWGDPTLPAATAWLAHRATP